jgi:zinc transporter 1/2/3
MAVASAPRFAELVPAIFFHQVFEGIAIGVRLAGLTKPPEDKSADSCPAETSESLHIQTAAEPTFVPSRIERILPPLLSLLFALPIPLILFISLFIPAFQATSSTLTGVFGLDNSVLLDTASDIHVRSETMQGVTSAVSAGLLIYVSCVELLAVDFLNNPKLQKSPTSVQIGVLVAFTAGAAGMSVI